MRINSPNRQRLSARDAQLLFDDIHTCDHFRDWVFYLYAGIHLDEIEVLNIIRTNFDHFKLVNGVVFLRSDIIPRKEICFLEVCVESSSTIVS